MHITSGRWVFGLLLALLTALLWGILPIKLKQVLQVMDPVTVTWYRLAVSGGLLFAWLAARGACLRSAGWAARANCWCWSPSAA
jgi:drug/metabolite transporter (DMT)-like permease